MRKNRVAALVVVFVAILIAAAFLSAPQMTKLASPPTSQRSSENLARLAHRLAQATAKRTNASPKPIAHMDTSNPANAQTMGQRFATLKSRADAGDPAAATQLFRDLNRCSYVRSMQQMLPKFLPQLLDSDLSHASDEQLKDNDAMLGLVQNQLNFVERNESFCADADESMLNQIVPASSQAAKLGDPLAARCYLGSTSVMSPGLMDHPEWITTFKQDAISMANDAVERGDWGVVGLLGHAYRGLFMNDFLAQVTGADPVKAYQYLKLQRLGASGKFIDKLDAQLADAADGLSDDQIAQADAWAQATYARAFAGKSSNELSNGVNMCNSADDSQ